MSGRISNMGRIAYHVVDAKGQVVGRLASQLAPILRGKHKPTYAPNVDCGDVVVVLNAKDIVLTGNKWDDKLYRWHTGFPGGLKTRTAKQIKEKDEGDVLRKAVMGMLPKNKMRALQIAKLKIFAGDEHTFQAELGENPKFL
ncbi:50S ribosomal protein L13 [Saprolegnia diclina VS20]|uniref:50S ribosomal protein L13 n=1 Tax=Saprolegnia diclina (strain VS20) TaxID=1156394 RepID=T0R0U4_SAPDV|nr:50S ribosomal protein L13 [Saprolegnia diclina VS20]EQC39920.1 50S ribosomal protein L13 [Saprolegnia diclina VS20]|eukprot:XP_008606394.1 50S ribosomal protein L13 [Saprolegnia diclina VS20]